MIVKKIFEKKKLQVLLQIPIQLIFEKNERKIQNSSFFLLYKNYCIITITDLKMKNLKNGRERGGFHLW